MAYKYCMDKQYKDSVVVVNGFGCGSGMVQLLATERY